MLLSYLKIFTEDSEFHAVIFRELSWKVTSCGWYSASVITRISTTQLCRPMGQMLLSAFCL